MDGLRPAAFLVHPRPVVFKALNSTHDSMSFAQRINRRNVCPLVGKGREYSVRLNYTFELVVTRRVYDPAGRTEIAFC